MTTKGFYRFAGFFGILSAAGFLWYLIGFLLITLSRGSVPMEALLSGEAATGRLAVLSQHPWWRIVHAGRCAGVLTGIFFTVTIMVSRRDKLSAPAFLSALIALAGLTAYAGMAFAETVLWPPAAITAPSLLDTLFGPFYADRVFVLTQLSGSVAFAAGSFLFGLLLLSRESWPGALLYSMGALALGLGFLAGPYAWGVQSMGTLLYVLGLVLLSVKLFRRKGLLISAE